SGDLCSGVGSGAICSGVGSGGGENCFVGEVFLFVVEVEVIEV
ncbi:hypothetical protein L195_g063788, partial [Trifolium pratense]